MSNKKQPLRTRTLLYSDFEKELKTKLEKILITTYKKNRMTTRFDFTAIKE